MTDGASGAASEAAAAAAGKTIERRVNRARAESGQTRLLLAGTGAKPDVQYRERLSKDQDADYSRTLF